MDNKGIPLDKNKLNQIKFHTSERDKLAEFSRQLKEWRTANSVTQKVLGEMLCVSKQAIYQYENGKCFPSKDTSLKLSEITRLDVPYSRNSYLRHLNEPLTDEERQFAEFHHNLIYSFLDRCKLTVDDWYDIAALEYLKAVKLWFARDDLHVYQFTTIAFYRMRTGVSNEIAKRKRRAKYVSIYDVIPGTDGFTYGDMLCAPHDCVGI